MSTTIKYIFSIFVRTRYCSYTVHRCYDLYVLKYISMHDTKLYVVKYIYHEDLKPVLVFYFWNVPSGDIFQVAVRFLFVGGIGACGGPSICCFCVGCIGACSGSSLGCFCVGGLEA